MKPVLPTNNNHQPSVKPKNLLLLIDKADFPASKTSIIDVALKNGASNEALDIFRALPKEEYSTLSDVNADLGLIEQIPGQTNIFGSKPARSF